MATGRVPTTANSPLTAKGDLFGYSTAPARLAVGNDGEQIVADSSATTGLRYRADYAAGKNKIINGDFGIWQRGTSFTITSTNAYTADRFQVDSGFPQTVTVTQQAFTPGAAPVAGYESQYFIRLAYSANESTTAIRQYIEDVRTLAGETATLSFYAKVSSGTKSITPRFVQNFGSGGSSVVVTNASAVTLTTSWQRFSVTVSVPSVSGKTIGTGSNLHIDFSMLPDSLSYDFWGFQVEAGSVATAFQTATGTLQGELAACRRYLPAITTPSGFGQAFMGYAYATNGGIYSIPFDVQARVAPTGITVPAVSGSTFIVYNKTNGDASASAISFDVAGVNGATVLSTATLTQGDATRLLVKGSGGYILFTGCEL
jgi:hypothetical protein